MKKKNMKLTRIMVKNVDFIEIKRVSKYLQENTIRISTKNIQYLEIYTNLNTNFDTNLPKEKEINKEKEKEIEKEINREIKKIEK